MSLPVRLGIGMLSIYGQGSPNGLFQSAQDNNPSVRFGVVDSAYNIYGSVGEGQSVIYKVEDSVPIFYIDTQYWLVPEDKILAIENPVIIPPAP